MTLRWIDGAEGWGDGTYATRAYQDANSIGTQTARVSPGVRSWTLSSGGNLLTPSLGVQNTWVIGFGLYVDSTSGTEIRVFSGGTEQCRIETENSGGLPRFNLRRGATSIATSSTFALNQWHYFELKVTVRTGTDGVYELRRNEVDIMSGSSVNLANAGSDGADVFGIDCNTGNLRLDDLYILDSTGSTNNDFKGDSVCIHILPTSEGHQIDFAPSTGADNSATVDDPSTAASSADWNSSDTNAHEDYYGFENLPPTGIGTIHGIRLSASWAMETTGSRVARYRYYNGSVEFTAGSNVTAANTSLVELPQVVELNPDTGVNWTKADIDAAEFGVEVVS